MSALPSRLGATRHSAPMASAPARPSKGAEIRARIAANRAKRLSISETMKREAGVKVHHINREDMGGLAWIGTGHIRSPEGRNMAQLHIVAHECGHIYLHSDATGKALPAHVMEMEAESYAHQAFAHHGMTIPKRQTEWGRRYVGSWIDKDRAAGIAIDPRAEAYAQGTRCPFEPLRKEPFTWRSEEARAALAYEVATGAPAGRYLEIVDPAGSTSPQAPTPWVETWRLTKALTLHLLWGSWAIFIVAEVTYHSGRWTGKPIEASFESFAEMLSFALPAGVSWAVLYATWRVAVGGGGDGSSRRHEQHSQVPPRQDRFQV